MDLNEIIVFTRVVQAGSFKTAPSTPAHVVYPSTRHLSPKVKTFVDHLHERMTPSPWEIEPLSRSRPKRGRGSPKPER